MENINFNKGAINVGECLSRGWEIVKPNYFMFFGMGAIILILGCIPVISWIIAGPILVGVYYAMLRQYRGESVEFGMLFQGFNKFFPAMIIGFLFLLPGGISNLYRIGLRLAEFLAIYNPNELTGGLAALMTLLSFLISGFTLLGSIILFITLAFGLPLLAEYDLSLMEAIKLSAKAGWGNFGGMFLLMLLLGAIILAGILALCVGLFFVLPIIYAAITVAYKQVFPGAGQMQ